MEEQKVKPQMKISDIVETYPDVIPLLMSYGLHCVGCAYSELDTLESGAKLHGIPDDEIRMMVDDCNRMLKELGEEGD